MKPNIKDLDYNEAVKLFSSLEEKDYRAAQLFNWLYERNVSSFNEMTNFSKNLRARLEKMFDVTPLQVADKQISKIDSTEKYLFRTADGHYIESVLLKSDPDGEGRLTICISSQIGCLMGCGFCETAKIGFKRNLSAGEILDQICHIRRESALKNNNIVFMGMGEPFLNYDNVMKAADIMNYTFGFHLSVRKITISTCGILPSIERYIDEKRPYNLALSLNDTDPLKRAENMPVEKKYPFEKIARMLEHKFPVSRNRLTIEYIMRKDNISPKDAKRLKKMFRFSRIKLNLIPLNPGNHNLPVPDENDIKRFTDELQIMNIPVSIRKSMGQDISGACGQLSGMKYSETACFL
jgi:23S rRNA (adenine2503-C2)-methyltransferase